jgi:ABC-type glycerol-3-phosphate transport system substrate-binding protein
MGGNNKMTYKNRISKFSIIAIVILVVFSMLSGCSGGSGGGTTSAAATTTATTTVAATTTATAAATTTSQSAEKRKFVNVSTGTDEGTYSDVLKKWLEIHPDVEYEHVFFTSAQYTEMYATMKNANEQVDLLSMNAQDLRRYATNGDIKPLDDIIPFKDRYREIGIKTFTINNVWWGVPYGSIGGFVISYNKTLLDKYGFTYPDTYEDLVQIGVKLKEDGIAAYSHAGKNIYVWPVWFFTMYEQTTGGKSLEYTLDTLRGDRKFTDDEVVAGLDAIFALSRDGLFIDGVNGTDDDGNLANMVTQRAVFMLGGSWKAVRDASPEGTEIDVGLFPHITPERIQSIYPGGTGSALSIPTNVPDENIPLIVDYIDFITSDENVRYRAVEDAWSTTTNENVGAVSDEPYMQKFAAEVAEHLVVYLDWYWPPEITRAFQEGIQAGVALQKTAKEVSQDIQNEFDRLVAEGYVFTD